MESEELIEKFKTINDEMELILSEKMSKTKEFLLRLQKKWGKCLKISYELYYWILKISDEYQNMVSQLSEDYNKGAVYDTLCHINARALQEYLEILTLCENGFADGAFARWRSIYELSIISQFIIDNGEKVAKQYINSNYMESGTYDWAKEAKCFKNCKYVSFKKIEDKYSNSNNGNKIYKEACNFVHSSAKATYFKMGSKEIFTSEKLIAGRSVYGIDMPAINAAISLCKINSIYLSIYSENINSNDLDLNQSLFISWINLIKSEYSKI